MLVFARLRLGGQVVIVVVVESDGAGRGWTKAGADQLCCAAASPTQRQRQEGLRAESGLYTLLLIVGLSTPRSSHRDSLVIAHSHTESQAKSRD